MRARQRGREGSSSEVRRDSTQQVELVERDTASGARKSTGVEQDAMGDMDRRRGAETRAGSKGGRSGEGREREGGERKAGRAQSKRK
eukprot:6206159-Pleurochrysis_carterae.AAC.1